MENKTGTREEWFKGKCHFCGKEIILLIAARDKFLQNCASRIVIAICCKLIKQTTKDKDGVTVTEGISVPDLTRVKSKTWYK